MHGEDGSLTMGITRFPGPGEGEVSSASVSVSGRAVKRMQSDRELQRLGTYTIGPEIQEGERGVARRWVVPTPAGHQGLAGCDASARLF